MPRSRSQGFTLIELLVVISIIGMLSSVILTSVNASRVKSRNSYTTGMIKQYMNAFTLIYDKDGSYPLLGASCLGVGSCITGVSHNLALDGKLNQFISQQNTNIKQIDIGGGITVDSAYYYCNTISGGLCTLGDIVWYMEGNAPCPFNAQKTLIGGNTKCEAGAGGERAGGT